MESQVPKERTILDHFTLLCGLAVPVALHTIPWPNLLDKDFALTFPLFLVIGLVTLITNFRRATEGEPSRWRLAHRIATVTIIMILAVPLLFELVQIIKGMDEI